MRHFDCNPYFRQELEWDKAEEKAAYKEMIAEEQGEKAQELYDKLPEDPEGILSQKMMETFGELLDKDSDAQECLNSLLYDLSLLEIKRRGAVEE
ncbi:hypothetical protein [Xenorhabdus indica]|uniref:hypothetical protein n=1 Tax=Xenorhabdus indica TaxID=333964 RepID=UPI0016574C85|nr:hypothetical protein [Xenorhabdus indica]MBC8947372.1 hypothetical protein [Xenorhabdus indica]